MCQTKKPYLKPEIQLHAPGSPAYEHFMSLLAEEQQQAKLIAESLLGIKERSHNTVDQEAYHV